MWRVVPWARLLGVAVLAAFGLLDGHVSELALSCLAALVAVVVASSDRLCTLPPPQPSRALCESGQTR